MTFKYIPSLVLLLLLVANPRLPAAQLAPSEMSVTVNRLTLRYDTQTRLIELHDANEGILVSSGVIRAKAGGRDVSTHAPGPSPVIREHGDGVLAIEFADSLMVRFALPSDSEVSITAEGPGSDAVHFTARAKLSDRTLGGHLENEQEKDRHTLVQTLGVSGVPDVKSIFDPLRDLAIQVESDGVAGWSPFHPWQLNATAKQGEALCSIKLFRNYYRDTLGVTYYAPVTKRSYFQKAPALAMTWVGIEGKYNRPHFSQRKEWLFPNIDWVSQHLLPYAEEMVFQLDDNYPIDDPRYMRDISDYIRGKGLIPGIWMAPFGVAPFEEVKKHPEWFIHKPDGSAITTFSGLSYDDVKHYNSGVLNVNHEEAVNKWFGGFLREVRNEWKYDYFKMDGIPAILKVYSQSVDGGGVEGVRRGMQIIRSIVGPDTYVNACWGLPMDVMGLVNGSRVGGDTEQENQVLSHVAVAQNYLNNVAWYSDPDGAANMYASTTARARLNFQGRAMLGQPYVTDDHWTQVPDDILHVWQKTLPTIESFPANLYPIEDPDPYDHFDLKIKKPWGRWDIVGLNNYENKARRMTLDLGRLALASAEVYVYDFWNQKFLGTYGREAKIIRNLAAIDAHCFSVVPVQPDRPVLLSTSRHITQGGIDLLKMDTVMAGDAWLASGVSHHLIKDDPYDMVFVTNGYVLDTAKVNHGSVKILSSVGVARLRIIPDHENVEWEIRFRPQGNRLVGFGAELVHVVPGQPVEVPVMTPHGKPARWTVKSSDETITVEEDHARSIINVNVDPDVLVADGTWTGHLTLESNDAAVSASPLMIEALGPVRENIAVKAKASASSVYFQGDQNGYGRPTGVNDMRTFTAWEAAEGKTDGWIELIWDKPVTFQRMVIDEWLESGGGIQAWVLEAGHKRHEVTPRNESRPKVTYAPASETMKVIQAGARMGRKHVIELDEPITANVLRLTIHKAARRPGIWEIVVNPFQP